MKLVVVKNPYASSENAKDANDKHIRAQLMVIIRKIIQEKGLTQAKAAALLDTSQARISEITRGKTENHTIDKLFAMLQRLGWDFNFTYNEGTITTSAARRDVA